MKQFNICPQRLLAGLALVLPTFFVSGAASAEDYPSHPITLVVPFSAGGGTDSIARDVARTLSDRLGQPVVVENRGCGGGPIGATLVANARPDGYTLLFATSTFVTNAAAEISTNYDVIKSFTPIAMLGRGPLFVVSAKDLKLKSVADLRTLAAKPDAELNFCSAGNGSINHLAGELFKQKTQAAMTHVPYKGSGPATVDLLAGRVQVFFATVPTILSQVRDQRMDLLAVTGKERSPLFPDTPTVAESGIADFDITTWWGVLAPAGTPPAIIGKLNAAINDAAADKLVADRLRHEGAQAIRGTPDDFGQALATELQMWQGVVKQSGMALD
ncbi:tripartite tricarboxylate transporter substrate binding protein [Bordetella holmesii]|uniref:Tripartite tricarboxylate transporter family receptor n=2 Tax=Bordetella holmesii TaxID=35814 RepID=A0A158MB74_9BORD|nr:tripartite tricarboxylate transporter substrate binding protein [Bordetella holmesii]AHV94867.1 tripartite tricarboxylate transporter receptor family protein [Bordetella holmesii ATCC 51541]AIT27398.1 tripartite tricarboxylate transporter receptor family protein [Bordetella holmesii 44057]EWM47988.1 tripartite tricarboxylate transporter receptor family protein [Bordetella holmesii 35009]AMD46235.1 Fis family transcriptional regulator [Bordetella holmesii H558]AMD48365.1 MFS transporter [Bor